MAGRKACVSEREAALVEVCKKTYRKHVLQDDSIGWGQLSSCLGDTLAFVMGDKGFVAWLDTVSKEKPII